MFKYGPKTVNQQCRWTVFGIKIQQKSVSYVWITRTGLQLYIITLFSAIIEKMADINVTVEPPLENQIVEVTYDGQEIIQPPLTQGENLMRQVSNFRIFFVLLQFDIIF